MKRLITLVGVALVATGAQATLRMAVSNGNWNEASTWYDDADGNRNRLPKDGDQCYVGEGQVCTIPSGWTVTNLTIFVGRRNTGVGTLIIEEGAVVSNCTMEVAQVAGGTVTYTAKRATVEQRGGLVYFAAAGNFKLNNYCRYVQSGGFLRLPNTMTVASLGRYEFTGGTNDCNALFSADAVTTNNLCVSVGPDAVFGEHCGEFCLNGGSGVFNGCTFLHSCPLLKSAQNSKGSASLRLEAISNTVMKLYAAGSGNQRHSFTGNVEIVDCQIRVDDLAMASQLSNCCARLTIENSNFWLPKSLEGANGDVKRPTNTRTITVKGDSLVTFGGRDSSDVITWYDPDDWTGFFGSKSFNLQLGSGTTLNVEGGTVRIADRLFLFAGGTLNVTGGQVRPKRTFTGTGLVNGHEYTNPCRVIVDGGVFRSKDAIMFGRDGNNTSPSPIPVEMTIRNSVVTNDFNVAQYSTNQVMKLTLDNGTLGPTCQLNQYLPRTLEMRFKGAAMPFMFKGFNNPDAVLDDFLNEFIPDSTPGNLSPVVFTDGGSARMTGNLRIRPDGGALLTTNTAFTLLKVDPYWDGSGTKLYHGTLLKYNNGTEKANRFRSLPDETLWATSLSADAMTFCAALTDPVASTSAGGKVDFAAAPKAMGSATVGGICTGNLKELTVAMKLCAADGSALGADAKAEIAQGFVDAGYTNSCVSASADADVDLVVPGELVPASSVRFVWDFTRTVSARTPDLVTTNALLKAFCVRETPIKKGFVLIFR